MLQLLKSKLVWGAVVASAGWLLNQPQISPVEIMQAIGMVIAAIGGRDAIRKIAPTDSIEGQKQQNDSTK